jgi:hypothetical protein
MIVYGRWKLGFNDPAIAGWITTAVYIVTAFLCLTYARCAETSRGHRVFWMGLALGLFVRGINKQLDLHVLLESVGRGISKRYGWYLQRRTIQMWFVTGLAAVGLIFLIIIGLKTYGVSHLRLLAFCGIVLLAAFIIARAASMHHVFEMLKMKLPESWLFGILQWSGIICIGLSASIGIVNHRKRINNHSPS